MFNRRKFLGSSLLTAAAAGLGLWSCETNGQEESATKNTVKESKIDVTLPLVIATWDNKEATKAAMESFKNGGSSLDAVESGVKVVEADPDNITVGYGGLPDRDGHVTLDACIMDHEGNAGSVTFLENIMHPISVARKVMEETPHVMLSGKGALQFALDNGFETQDLLTDTSRELWQEWMKEEKYAPKINIERHDTIGMLAIDENNRISGACTTSGVAFKMHGRVGDSPIIGAGLFVDNEVGAAVATGLGELVMKTLGSFLVVELMRQGRSPQEACEEAIGRIVDKYKDKMDDSFQVGYIAINSQGEKGAYSVVDGFNYTLYEGEKNEVYEAKYAIKREENE